MPEIVKIYIAIMIIPTTGAPESMGNYVLPAFNNLEELRKHYPEPVQFITVEGLMNTETTVKEVN